MSISAAERRNQNDMVSGFQRGGSRAKTPNDALLTESNTSNNTSSFYGLPPVAGKVCPVSFGIKFSPPKLGLQYHLPGRPEEQLLFEVVLTPFINKGLDCEQIVNQLFELHRDFINSRVIARQQVRRLVDRVLLRLSPEHVRKQADGQNKENSPSLNNSQRSGPPADPSLQMNMDSKSKMQILFDQNKATAMPSSSGQLEAAPDSERSDAFSLPSGDNLDSDRLRQEGIGQGKFGGKQDMSEDNFNDSAQNSAVKALENLDINLQEINNLNQAADAPSELLMSEIHVNNQNSAKKDDGDLAEMEQMLKSGNFQKNLSGTFKQMSNQSEDKMSSNAHVSDVDVNFNGNLHASPSPGKLTGAEGQIFQQNSESQPSALAGFNSQMDDSQPIDLEGLNESELLALQEQAQKELDAQGQEVGEDQDQDDEDVIDVDNPEDLAKKGLRRIQIEGDEQEYLLDNDGNIYNLQGEFVGTTDGDVEEEEGEPAQKDK